MRKFILFTYLMSSFFYSHAQDNNSTSRILGVQTLSPKAISVAGYSGQMEIVHSSELDFSEAKAHLLIKESGSGYGRIRFINTLNPSFNSFWDIRAETYTGGPIPDRYLAFAFGLNDRMIIKEGGNIGIGTTSPASKLQLHEPTSGLIQAMQITTDGTGALATDGLGFTIFSSSDILTPRAARIMNNENGQLILGANNLNVMRITPTGNVGINSAFAPSARFQVYHDTENDPTKPHVNLVTAVDANNGMIKMTNLLGNKYFGQYFNINSATAANNFISFDYNGTTPILDMQGNGNVKVSGFTTLGNDASAPKIKMKKLSGTFNANANTSGTPTNIPHGVADPTKIITINVLGRYAGSGGYVSNSFLTSNGYQFDYQIDGVNIIVTPKQGNSASLVSQNIKVVITYEE